MSEMLSYKKSFIDQLQERINDFIQFAEARAKEEGGSADKDTFEIDICNKYLAMRIECENADGDTFSITQEIVMKKDGYIYQGELLTYNVTELW